MLDTKVIKSDKSVVDGVIFRLIKSEDKYLVYLPSEARVTKGIRTGSNVLKEE